MGTVPVGFSSVRSVSRGSLFPSGPRSGFELQFTVSGLGCHGCPGLRFPAHRVLRGSSCVLGFVRTGSRPRPSFSSRLMSLAFGLGALGQGHELGAHLRLRACCMGLRFVARGLRVWLRHVAVLLGLEAYALSLG